jgi:ribosomal protein S18 acetylase RimI-like enzyme
MIEIRRARKDDLPAVAALTGELVRLHHATDPKRFLLVDNVDQGYAWWFGKQLANDQAVILVATEEGRIAGYAYGSLEDRDWNMLLDEHGAIHDIFVAKDARRLGTGKALMNAIVAALETLGAARIVLSTMPSNDAAQRLFASCGFRPTMLEMTRG